MIVILFGAIVLSALLVFLLTDLPLALLNGFHPSLWLTLAIAAIFAWGIGGEK